MKTEIDKEKFRSIPEVDLKKEKDTYVFRNKKATKKQFFIKKIKSCPLDKGSYK